MTQMLSGGVEALRAAMDGPVVVPGDTGYDQGRRVWNSGIDRYPGAIAHCTSTADVVAAIGFARAGGLEVSVRGGAHNSSGTAVCDGGLMIDLSRMNQVEVDPDGRRALVGGGALLTDLDSAAQAHGLAVPAGMIGHTGVGGLALGGGMGWLSRKFGLSIDNLLSAEVVTADGRVLRAAADENPDLFWAIRGGGGNFGVVTTFEFRLHPVHPVVEFGLFFWRLEQGPAVLRLARELIATMAPDLNIVIAAVNAPPAPFVPEEHRFLPGYALLLTGFDGTPAFTEAAGRIRGDLPPLFDVVTPMPYVELQKLLDEANAWGQHCYEKGTSVAELSDQVIDVITEHVPLKTSPMSAVLFYRLDAAYSRVDENATAFGGTRSPQFALAIVGLTPDAELLEPERGWVRGFWEALRPLAIGSGEGYVNAMCEYGDERLRATFGPAKYERLARIKALYDPDNFFHRNANIKPM